MHLDIIARDTSAFGRLDVKGQASLNALLSLAEDAPPDPVEVVAKTFYDRIHKGYQLPWDGELYPDKWRDAARAAIAAYEGVREGTE